MIRLANARTADPPPPPKWFNSLITHHSGSLADIRQHIPDFERRPFAMPQPSGNSSRLNENLDTIVRCPFAKDQSFVPVGVVSSVPASPCSGSTPVRPGATSRPAPPTSSP